MGLLEDDSVWADTLSDAIVGGMPLALRQLFAYICVFGSPYEPNKLWENFKGHLIEDLTRKHIDHSSGCTQCEDLALCDLQNTLL